MDYFVAVLAVLLVLAVVDLSVGVSNDAVNFMNSAIGSRVASGRVILLVVCAGVICGALFASGIMQVARNGIINPELFVFADVMIIFLAVMLADVLLLDIFNTYGLPTSTTVSIVFELLGAATAVAVLISITSADGYSFYEYINGKQALTIFTGIFLSVFLAFVVGTVVQFFSRMLFTFDEKSSSATVRICWSAVALTVITDFLFIKGMKGASFIPHEFMQRVEENLLVTSVGLSLFWLCVCILLHVGGRNPLKLTVLIGTFALAMAFASNDLVNFIGVPLAALDSWRSWSASGVDAELFLMSELAQPVTGNTTLLLAAGVVMAITLWLSGKAQTVSETSVNLCRQDEGREKFTPGPVSRGLVNVVRRAAEQIRVLTPLRMQAIIGKRYQRDAHAALPDAPAFDLVRASVNLAVASILIAMATSMKLPLSTTFVTFMVAMGASLADQAWGRNSAAYRVAGVLSVLSGWFVTAAAAFLLAAMFAIFLKFSGGWGVSVLVVLVAFSMFRTFQFHSKHSQREIREQEKTLAHASQVRLEHLLQTQLDDLLKECSECLDLSLRGLLKLDDKLLKQARERIAELSSSCGTKEKSFVLILKQLRPDINGELLGRMKLLSCQQDLFQSMQTIVNATSQHVLDAHGQLTDETGALLLRFNALQRETVQLQEEAWQSADKRQEVGQRLLQLHGLLNDSIQAAVKDLYDGVRPVSFTTLLLTLLTELQDFAREIDRARTLWSDHVELPPVVSSVKP